MKKKLVLSILLSIFLLISIIPIILALEINIKTYPDHRVSVIIRNAGELTTADSYHQPTGDGNVKITSSVGSSIIDLLVSLKNQEGIKILDKKFEGVVANKPVNINFVPGNVGLVEPEPVSGATETAGNTTITENVSSETTETTTEQPSTKPAEQPAETETKTTEQTAEQTAVTGKAIESIKNFLNSSYLYYIIGIIVLVIVIFFVVRFARQKFGGGWGDSGGGAGGGKGDKFKVVKFSSSYDRELSHAERKLEAAQKELEYLKNRRGRLKEARERLKRDEAELRRLESGY